jgi:peptidoglycan hydrolase CwlO-like protein
MVPNVLTQHLERQVGELNRNIQSLTNEKKSHETIMFQLQQDLKSVQDKKQLAEEEVNRAQGETARLRDQVRDS